MSEEGTRLGQMVFEKREEMKLSRRALARLARVPKTLILDLEKGYLVFPNLRVMFVINKLDFTTEQRKEVYELIHIISSAFKEKPKQIQNRPGRKVFPRRRPSAPIDVFLRNRTFSFSY